MLIVFGMTTLVHVLVVSVARRRRETGLLRALGFVRRQIAYSVWWQTTTIALVGLVVGVPVGIAVGRAIWQEFARSLGVLPDVVVRHVGHRRHRGRDLRRRQRTRHRSRSRRQPIPTFVPSEVGIGSRESVKRKLDRGDHE